MGEMREPHGNSFLISVVVPTWNRASLLRGCLNSLLKQIDPSGDYEIIVVDDGSTDDTATVVQSISRESRGLPVRYVCQVHGGLNAGRNTGIRTARGEVVCFIDDDEFVAPHFMLRLRKLLSSRSDVSGIGGPYQEFGESKLRTCRGCSLATVDLPGEGRRIVEYLLGGNMAIRRAAFEEVGLFDEELSGRGDETEWFHRARGLRFLYDPDLWVWHRRDGVGLVQLCRSGFRQGLATPRYRRKVGIPTRPRFLMVGRYLGHAVRRQCARGLVLAAREAGALTEYFRSRLRSGRT